MSRLRTVPAALMWAAPVDCMAATPQTARSPASQGAASPSTLM